MTGWGSVLAIEAQERIFYALAGNIALNNCFNARALHAAVTARDGTLRVPSPDYQRPGSFGSLELRQRPSNEFIGQAIDYSDGALYEIKTVALDSLGLSRVDLIKIDVEGMELEVLAGASAALASCRPVILIEWIKSTKPPLMRFFASLDYMVFEAGINLIAVHKDDRCLGHVQQGGPNRPS
jgi:FkbM family methyltransferase